MEVIVTKMALAQLSRIYPYQIRFPLNGAPNTYLIVRDSQYLMYQSILQQSAHQSSFPIFNFDKSNNIKH